MRILSIEFQNVRRFVDPVRIEGIDGGINLLCESNEHGKSTVFDAVHALFFVPHRRSTAAVKALRPYAGGVPEVAVEIETGAGRFRIEKRWLSSQRARVSQRGELIAQADEAEAWIGRLLGDEAGGPSGLLWVRQGAMGISDNANLETRRGLLSSVAGEVESMTGGRRMDRALDQCRQDLERFVTTTGRAKKGGLLQAGQEEVTRLEAEHGELDKLAHELAANLAQRASLQRELSDLERPEDVRARAVRLTEARRRLDEARHHARSVERANEAAKLATLEAREAEGELTRMRAAKAELANATRTALSAAELDAAAQGALAATEVRYRSAEANAEAKRRTAEAAERAHAAALRRDAAAGGEQRRADLEARTNLAESARRQLEEARAAVAACPDETALDDVDRAVSRLERAQALVEADAPRVTVAYASGGAGGVTLDGAPLADGTAVLLRPGAVLELRAIGHLSVRSGEGALGEHHTVRDAERELAAALRAARLDSVEAVRSARAARAEATRRVTAFEAQLETRAPRGIEALRAELAAIPMPLIGEAPPPTDEAEARLVRARGEQLAAEETERLVREEKARAQVAASEAAVKQRMADVQLSQARERSGVFAGRDEGLLAAHATDLQEAADRAEGARAALVAASPDLEAAEATEARACQAVEAARARVAEIAVARATLDERVAQRSGEAVMERLVDVEARLNAARERLAAANFEVRVLQRLEAALTAARGTARERYFAPVMEELGPLLRMLWPEAELRFCDSTLLPVALTRSGREEDVQVLSGGTQEQIALLVRLAFARLLAKGGRPTPVILDDALIFSDDDRIERMFDALHRQARDIQIIVLSCRQRAFRELGGRVLRLEPAGEDA